jgi:hypothetical protein
MQINFKNGSKIEVIETSEETKRSKPKELYTEWFKNPYAFIEYLYGNLHWYQKLYLTLMKFKYSHSPKVIAEKKYETLIRDIKGEDNE